MKINVPIYISTNDKHLICLKVFIDLFKKFWPNQSLNILGYTKPEEEFGDLVNFHSMGKQGTLKEWSTDLRNFFLNTEDDLFIYASEDYAFYKDTDAEWINFLIDIMKQDKNIGRINLVDPTEDENCTLDESIHYSVKQIKEFEGWSLYEQESFSQYKMTTQISIWNKKYLLKYLTPDMTPWDFETFASRRANDDSYYKVMMVYGNKFPVYKKESFQAGEWENKEHWIDNISESLLKDIEDWEKNEKENIKYSR